METDVEGFSGLEETSRLETNKVTHTHTHTHTHTNTRGLGLSSRHKPQTGKKILDMNEEKAQSRDRKKTMRIFKKQTEMF